MTTHAASPASYSAHVKARGRANPLPPSYTITGDVTRLSDGRGCPMTASSVFEAVAASGKAASTISGSVHEIRSVRNERRPS